MNKIKIIFSVMFAAMAVMLMSAAVFAAVPESVTGNGSKESPYMVKTYGELQGTFLGLDGGYGPYYIALANDITQTQDSGTEYSNGAVVTKYNHILKRYNSMIYLDLFGKTLKLDAKCSSDEKGMFTVTGGSLIINDSIGTGCIINNSQNHGIPTFYVSSANGMTPVLTINNGTFSTDRYNYIIYHVCPITSISAISTDINDAYCNINGGIINGCIITDAASVRDMSIKDCVLDNGESNVIYVQKVQNITAKAGLAILDSSTITVDGQTVDKSEWGSTVSGHVVIKNPSKPTIEKQPQTKNNLKVGNESTFNIETINGEKFDWFLLDSEGNHIPWSTAKKNNIVEKISVESQTYSDIEINNTLKIKVLSTLAENYQVYCEVMDSKYTLYSDVASIKLAKPEIVATNKNINNLINAESSLQYITNNVDTYNWHFLNENGEEIDWNEAQQNNIISVSGIRDSKLVWTILSKDANHCKLYCTMKGNGFTLNTEPVIIDIPIIITEQPPKIVYFETYNTANITLQAEGKNINYSWYFKTPDRTTFLLDEEFDDTNWTGSYEFRGLTTNGLTDKYDGTEMYCKVWNWDGCEVESEHFVLKAYQYDVDRNISIRLPKVGETYKDYISDVNSIVPAELVIDWDRFGISVKDRNGKYVKQESGYYSMEDDYVFKAGYKYEFCFYMYLPEYVSPLAIYKFESKGLIVNGTENGEADSYDENELYFIDFWTTPVLENDGDVNIDKKTNKTDAALLLKYISGTTVLNSEQLVHADMNGDDKYDMLDVIEILNKVA